MLKINISWRQNLYTDYYDYGHNRTVSKVEEHCKLNHLLQIVVKNAGEALSKEIMLRLVKALEEETGIQVPPESLLLSNQSWGVDATYDAEADVYSDSICVAKDFDCNKKEYKKKIMAFVRKRSEEIIRDYFMEPICMDYEEYYQ